MSWQAKRYRDGAQLTPEEEQRVFGNKKTSKHHVPPQRPDKHPRVIRVDARHHRAYHMLFGAAKSLEDCIFILKRDWWRVDSKSTNNLIVFPQTPPNSLPEPPAA